MATLKLILRPSAGGVSFAGSLCLRIIHRRSSKNLTIPGCRLYPSEWDAQGQNIIYPANDAKRTAYLKIWQKVVNEEYLLLSSYLQHLSGMGDYTLDELVHLYRNHKDEGRLCGYTETLCFELERRGKYRTARAYRTVTKGLMDFNRGRDIPLEQITSRLIKNFEAHLRDNGRLPNTISYYMRNLRAIYNKGVAGRRILLPISGSPFIGTYTGVTRTVKRSLSCEELKKFYNLDFTSLFKKQKQKQKCNIKEYSRLKSLEAAHLYFTFSFHARGMCFIDLAHLKKEDIRQGMIRYIRKKTGRQIELRITDAMQAIIDRFAPQVKDSPFLFPIIQVQPSTKSKSTQRKYVRTERLQYESALRAQNIRLKELCCLSGVDKPISTHWVRHTWATIGKQENIPLNVLSECLGHTSERTTLIYLGLLDNSLLDAANERITQAIQNRYLGR